MDQPECWAWLLAQIRDVLQQGRGVIILVPEAAQVKAVSVRLAADVPEPVTILDRRLTAKKELAQWTAVREGRARLILGTRSAVFAPVRDLGLQVIIDEENRSYKQEQSPYYHAREVAEMRGRIEQALTIVVSPAPSAEVWYQVANGAAEAVEFPSTAAASRQAIDLANYKPRYKTILSFPVQSAIRASLERSGRVLLFLNRRGSSTATRCNQCGRAVTCPRCDVAMSYLEDPGHLVCHRCDGSQPLPRRCPHCQGEYLRPTGIGLETVAVEARRLYPEVRVAIFDRESASVPRSARIVVGTQAVLRALRPGEMDLAVVLDFDAELNRMDFRSEHHAFALLTRLARLAGRQLMAQTHQPEDYALRCALKMDWAGFYEQELRHRRESGLPPYQHLLELTVRGPDEAGAAAQIAALHRALLAVDQPGVEILDPQPDARAKLRDQYRFIIILRGSSVPDLHQLVRSAPIQGPPEAGPDPDGQRGSVIGVRHLLSLFYVAADAERGCLSAA